MLQHCKLYNANVSNSFMTPHTESWHSC